MASPSNCGKRRSGRGPVRPRLFSSLRPAGFTLVELLAAMGIILTMVVLVAPAFTGISKGSALKAGGNTVSAMALLARQNSLSKNAMTAFVVLGAAGTDADYRAFSLFEITPHLDGTPAVTADWKQITEWKILADGVVADNCTFTASSVPMAPPFPTLQFRGTPVTAYQYAVFLPSGALTSQSPCHVRLAPGFFPPGSQTVRYTTAIGSGGAPANYYDISIVGATGYVKVDRP